MSPSTSFQRAGAPPGDELERDSLGLHAALTELIRTYQFRDRDLICCHDLSVSGYYGLDELVTRGRQTLNELAARLQLDKSSASRLADGLERRGYARRGSHPGDGRSILLEATSSGIAIHSRIVRDLLAGHRRMLSEFDPEVRKAMTRLIARLAGAASGRPQSGSDGGFQIEEAGDGHLDQVYALLREAGLPADGLADQYGEQYCVAVASGGRVIGVAGLEIYGRGGLLRSVAVDEGWRGRGIGAALTRDRLAYARRYGLLEVYALTTTAAGYFPRLGFAEIDREEVPPEVLEAPEFASICPSTATVLRHGLDAGEGEARGTGEAITAGQVRGAVRRRYGAAARQAARGAAAAGGGCCGPAEAPMGGQCCPITSGLYDPAEVEGLPDAAVLASLGCGNPTALAELRAGEVVLDLGSGGGIDVLLSARRVGPAGKAYGLDMTPDMLNLARQNARAAGVENVEFLQGEIENIPLPEASVDVIISNCVINLSPDKRRVLAEAYRVLRPGGRLAVSDIVVQGQLPEATRRDLGLWVECVAGALEESEFRGLLAEVGFEGIEVVPTREYAEYAAGGSKIVSASVRATKPS